MILKVLSWSYTQKYTRSIPSSNWYQIYYKKSLYRLTLEDIPFVNVYPKLSEVTGSD